jgi:hypothetical protein
MGRGAVVLFHRHRFGKGIPKIRKKPLPETKCTKKAFKKIVDLDNKIKALRVK